MSVAIHLDGDYENSSTQDSESNVRFADDLTISAETVMTLEATAGSVFPAGKLTLVAGSGLWVHDDMTSAASNKPLVIDTDFESEGDGTLTVVATKTITSNKSDVTITAWDIDMAGNLNAGTMTISVHGSKVGQTIGLGGTAGSMQIEALELQQMTAHAREHVGLGTTLEGSR